ncbi:alpha/beta fold hydrolase [Crossiella sp. CA-258035]|uniref:esterase/lipase family protein n=1 Tax=Crossiella sp. CA-258035 TaxID=2981138 RepID=UPI0024BC4EC9|nr:alpha/beta fold hydrolase [Crossiella sp. CA-258035]WHT22908.1 alpha/beta fold hydrolase [Crossiella sp. CA-258035]
MGRRSWTLTALVGALLAALAGPAAAARELPVAYHSPLAVAASLAHPGSAPPGANDWSCRSATRPRPVVLLHGTHVNMRINWHTLSPLLKNNGYCVFALNYGGLHAGQIGGTGDIPASAGELESFVDRVLAATGAAEVDFVGHSLGGTLAQYYVKFHGGAAKTHNVIGLAPTSHGSSALGLDEWIRTVLRVLPGLARFVNKADPAALQQLRGSEFIKRLNSSPDTVPGVRYTTIASRHDAVVTPYESQFLHGPGSTNILVQELCRNDFGEHLALAFDHVALREVLNALDPATARRPDCSRPVWPIIGG